MLSNEEAGHAGAERVYSDPSAAHECGLKFERLHAYRVVITPYKGSYIVEAWFYDIETCMAAIRTIGSGTKIL